MPSTEGRSSLMIVLVGVARRQSVAYDYEVDVKMMLIQLI
jgi:hypothetical protein